MTLVESIKQPILPELEEFNTVFTSAFTATGGLLNSVLKHLSRQRGKQIRPILILLSAKLCGKITPQTHLAAAAFETLHTASLVHDDVVDNTFVRRGQESVNALYDNKASVLVGDFLLTISMDYIARTRNYELNDCLVEIGKEISKGELLQLETAYQETSEKIYFEVIRKKTAVLFAQSAKAGAISAEATEEQKEALCRFGNNMGICFQIKDDIFDYTPTANIGKPTFNDIREGKITLPLIRTLELASTEEQAHIYKYIKDNNFEEEGISYINSCVQRYKGIDYAIGCMEHYKQKAIQELNIFPDSDIKQALINMLNYVLDRTI